MMARTAFEPLVNVDADFQAVADVLPVLVACATSFVYFKQDAVVDKHTLDDAGVA